jgi:nicotinamidase-related amidase
VIFLIRNPAVVLIDVQNDFFTGPLKTQRVPNIIGPLQLLVMAARKNDAE